MGQGQSEESEKANTRNHEKQKRNSSGKMKGKHENPIK